MIRLAFAAFLLAAPAQAQETAPAPVEKTSSTVSLPLSSGPLTGDQVIAEVEKADQGLKSLHTRFTQRMRVPGYGLDSTGEGEIWFEKERKLRVEQKSPTPQTIVSDGERLWIYSPATNQLIEQSWKDFEESKMMAQGLAQFGSYGNLRERYTVAASSRTEPDGGASYTVVLSPKDPKDLPFRVELAVRAPDFLPRRTTLIMNDMEVTTELVEPEVNAAIPPERFRFEPPADAMRMKMR